MENIFGGAEWIWPAELDKPNVYAVFFEEFDIPSGGGDYTFYISVDSNYALYVDGKLINCGQYTDFPHYKVYDALDLTGCLQEGKNIIKIECYHQGVDSSTCLGEKAGVIYRLARGSETVFKSSENSSCCPLVQYDMGRSVEMVSWQLGYSFRYDSRCINQARPGAAVICDKTKILHPRPIKKLELKENAPAYLTARGTFAEQKDKKATIGQRVQYASLAFADPNIRQPLPCLDGIEISGGAEKDGVFAVVDLGEESAGLLSLDIELPAEAEVLVGWGEHLDDMRVRAYVGGRNFCASYYGKAGRNIFTAPFRRLGLRYMQLHVYAPSFKLYYAGIRPTPYPIGHQNFFRCSDSLHNKIYDISLRTLLLCMHEHYEDCPWREQALYTMDSRNQMLCGYYTFNEYEFARASLRLMALSIREDNMLELCAPARVPITIPSFTAVYMTQVWEYMEHSGDTAFVLETLPVLRRIAGEFISRIDENTGLLTCFKEEKYWNFYEWQDGLAGSIAGFVDDDKITFDAPLCAFVALGLRSMFYLMNGLGLDGEAEIYYSAYKKLAEAADARFWDEERGVYASYISKTKGEKFHYCELTQSLFAVSGICGGARLDRVLRALKEGNLTYATLSHSIFKYDALMQKPEKYARFVFSDIAKKWGKMLYGNATSFWETQNGAADFSNAGSLCHGWSAIPAYFYLKYAVTLPANITGLYECETEL